MKTNLKMKLNELEIIPSKPYMSDVISCSNGNMWELHELYPEDQEIQIKLISNANIQRKEKS